MVADNMLRVKQVFMLVTTCLVIMIYMRLSPRPNCPVTNQIVINEALSGQGERLRAGKVADEEKVEEERHQVGREEFRGMNGLADKYNLIVVGAGLSGAVVAERASRLLGLSVLMIDKRNHIGGNCYDFIDEHGIRTSQYGVHIFHTKYDEVKEYVQQFSEWVPYEHRVVAKVKDMENRTKFVPMPPNQMTVNMLFKENITTKDQMVAWLNKRRPTYAKDYQPQNGEEMAMSRVGKELYEMLFKHYTKKQWDKYPAELDAAVLARLPYREDKDDRYFDDPWQHLPKNGYTFLFENMLLKNPLITVRLSTDYFDVKAELPDHDLLIFTGPIDAYFSNKGLPKLEYRSIFWEKEYLEPNSQFFQPAWVVNYPEPDVNWTRISEYKHAPNQPAGTKDYPGTVIYREYSTDVGDPYYPVPNQRNRDLFQKYQELSLKESGVKFVGRLASYKYFNMDEAIKNALQFFNQEIKNFKFSAIA